MLVYGPTSGGLEEGTPGYVVTVWDAATWASKTTADFAAFDVIVFEDNLFGGGTFFTTTTPWATAVANASVWGAAITGNKIVVGTDPDCHGKAALVHDLVTFAGDDPSPGPGLFVALSGAYNSTLAPGVPLALMSYFGAFTVVQSGGGNDVHKVATHPALNSVTDIDLSNWFQSTHEGFTAWPSTWLPLAIVRDAPTTPYTAPDGSVGLVYILAEGSALAAVPTPGPSPTISATFTETLTPTLSPTVTLTPTVTITSSQTKTTTFTITQTYTVTQTYTPTPPPLTLVLYSPNPNPSTDKVWLPFGIGTDADVDIQVWDIAGEPVRKFSPVFLAKGVHETLWDHRNDAGAAVASGVYIYRVRARSPAGEERRELSKCSIIR